MQKCLLPIALLLLVLAASHSLAAEAVQLQSESDRINYSIGYQIGGDFQKQGVGLNVEALAQGIRDVLEQREPLMPAREMNTTLQSLKERIVADERRGRDQQSREFLAEYRKKEGANELSNGVLYRELKAGTGAKPTLPDSVRINFRTTTIDGTEVSNTFTTNEPKSYRMSEVMPGLQAVLPLMSEGARWEVVIPVGHGGRRSKEALDKRGILVYEIDLLAVISPESK